MKRTFLIILSVLLLAATAFGCSAKQAATEANHSGGGYYAADAAYAEEPMYAPAEAESVSMSNRTEYKNQSPALENRKIIRNANVTVQTLEFDAFLEKLNEQVESLGGFVELYMVLRAGFEDSTDAGSGALIGLYVRPGCGS